MSASDWARIAERFKEWRKTVTLTAIGRWLGRNEAWDNYYCGYRDGVEEGVNRALGISAREIAYINNLLTDDAFAWAEPEDAVRKKIVSTGSTTAAEQASTYRVFRIIGGIIFVIGAVGGVTVIATALDLPHALPNIGNMLLFAAFGAATLVRKRVAVILGWTYFVLLALMTVLHGFIPLEIIQCVVLVVFLVYLRRQKFYW